MKRADKVRRVAIHHAIDPGLLLLAAIVGQAMDDAKRGDVGAAEWLQSTGFET